MENYVNLRKPHRPLRMLSNYDGGEWVRYICLLTCCRVMMLIMSVSISCYGLIAGSISFSNASGHCRGLWRRPLWQWLETKRQRMPQTATHLHYACSSSPPFHLSISSYPRLLTLIAASFLYDWGTYNPIRTAPCLWLGPTQIHKLTHKLTNRSVCDLLMRLMCFF